MKQLLVIAIALASVNAFASRARMNALGNNVQLVDTQTVMTNPADMMFIGDFANIESGSTAPGLAAVTYQKNTEGTVTRSYGNSKFGLTLGYLSKNAAAYSNGTGTPGLRFASSAIFLQNAFGLTNPQATALGLGNGTTDAGVKGQQNPVNVHYATKIDDWAVGGTLVYSNYNDKKANEKESSSGLRFGARNDVWDAKLGIGLGNNYETAAAKFSGTSGYSAGVGYKMDDMYFNLNFETAGFKLEKSSVEKIKLDYTSITLAAIKNYKTEAGNLFYGASLTQDERKFTLSDALVGGTLDVKQTGLSLPLIVGFEADAASWLTLRGSVSQKTLINSGKVESGSTTAQEFSPGANSTIAAIGAGLKFNKLTLDGSLEGLTDGTQTLNGNKLLTQVGLTYLF